MVWVLLVHLFKRATARAQPNSQRIADGDFSARKGITRADEIAELAQALAALVSTYDTRALGLELSKKIRPDWG